MKLSDRSHLTVHSKGTHTRIAVVLSLVLSVALHAVVLALANNYQFNKSDAPKADEKIVYLEVVSPRSEKQLPEPVIPSTAKAPKAVPAIQAPQGERIATRATEERQAASMAAPSAPTAQEWAFAAKYTNKNSKGYRYHWGQQVRSMMGTAVAGKDQGVVRFRLEIAPDGTLAKLETLWSTSTVAEQLARKAISNLPPLPPTPTGKPLVFERTISFTPYESGGPPVYKNDCLPDASIFRNPFAWDGTSPRVRAEDKPIEKPDPQAYEECKKQLPQDSIEADVANNKAKMDRWGWSSSKLGQ
jgi:hypothetical protein